jgi:hypothetical protein
MDPSFPIQDNITPAGLKKYPPPADPPAPFVDSGSSDRSSFGKANFQRWNSDFNHQD